MRCVLPHAAGDLKSFLSSDLAASWIAAHHLTSATDITGTPAHEAHPDWVSDVPGGGMLIEHPPITFPNFPYEWAPQMLHSAAALTLKLAREAVAADFTLKDATPYNIMFEGPRPVFIDLLSFKRRDERDGLWRPYAQFMRTFIYPLLACRYFDLRLDEMLLTNSDGVEPERMLRLCSPWRLLWPPLLGTVTIPAILSRGEKGVGPEQYRTRLARDGAEARFLLDRLFGRADRLLRRISIPAGKGAVARYMDEGHNYSPGEWTAKEQAVTAALREHEPHSVLDAGCNTGHFSLLAARQGARVVAIDRDPEAVGALWEAASRERLEILPLVIDMARPPGACGWANSEFPSFLDRARERFDCVLLLAIMHHLLVNDRVPLENILEFVAGLTTKLAIVEYVDPADERFQRIARGREALHEDLTPAALETAARRWFTIVEWRQVTATRRIYVLRKERG